MKNFVFTKREKTLLVQQVQIPKETFRRNGGETRARICRPFKEPRNRFPAWRAGTTTLFVVPVRQATVHTLAESIPPNRYLGYINVYKYGLCIWNPMRRQLKRVPTADSPSCRNWLRRLHKPVLEPVSRRGGRGVSQCSKFSHDRFRIVFSINVAVLHEAWNKKLRWYGISHSNKKQRWYGISHNI